MRTVSLTPTDLTFGGPADRFAKNIAALRLLRDLEQSNRSASSAELRVLAHYTAFGESALITRLVNQPDGVVTEEELAGLTRAALTAFYTPLPVAAAIWQALARLGLAALGTLRVLEPAAGVGHFLSVMPPDLRARAQITAVEREPLSARILGHLHPDVTLHAGVGVQDVALPADHFDLVISNVPFGDVGVADPTMPERFLTARVHDYFFAKAIRLVRPGGLIAFLTSYGTLDKRDARLRRWLADRADLRAAVRLPSGLFAENAGSHAGADLLILRRYEAQDVPQLAPWVALAEVDLPTWTGGRLPCTTGSRVGRADDPLRSNTVFAAHPEQVIGTAYAVRDRDRLAYVVVPPDDMPIADALARCLDRVLPHAAIVPVLPAPPQPAGAPAARPMTADVLDPAAVPAAQRARATALVAVYDAAKTLIRQEIQDADDATLDAARATLNRAYDAFVASYGCISVPSTRRLFQHLPELAFLSALEERAHRAADGGWVADKAPIFTRRTLRPLPRLDDGTLSVPDALIRALDVTGGVDLPLICRLSGQDADTVRTELHGVIFRVPDLTVEAYQTADHYLSGNVRAKLRQARALAAHTPAFQHHVAALEAVQPPLLGAEDIRVRLGAAWVPPAIIAAFVRHLLPTFQGTVTFQDFDASWHLTADDTTRHAVENTARWGTVRMPALDLLHALLSSSPIVVRDLIDRPDGGTTTVVNATATAAALEQASAIRAAFAAWVWADPEREEQLVAIYNERFNSLRPRQYDGAHLSLPGLNTAVLRDGDLSPWQKAAVWQALQNPATLLAHAVGAGKTFTMVAIAREARRMGLAHKPLLVVPNHLVGQTATEALRLFPGLRVLALDSEDFSKHRRGVVLSRIATGDWDLIIVPVTSFQFLPIDPDIREAFYARERSRLQTALEAAEGAARAAGTDTRSGKRAIKRIQAALERLEVRIKNALARITRDSARTITWRELGIDLLMVDEAHAFKNLYVPTRLQLAGVPQADSLRALDMRIKTWDLLQRGTKVLFATATPIMNTLGEAFVMQLYLQEAALRELGIDQFDAWVSVFAEVRDMVELTPDGAGFQIKSRLNTFINLPELAELWRTVLNVRTAAQLALPRPQLVTGAPIVVAVPASHALTQFIQQCARRVERIKNRQVDPQTDNMLTITSEARLAALDTRLILGGPEVPQNKINALVERVAFLAHTYAAARATQLVFCDLATPKLRRETPDATDAEAETPPSDAATADEQALQGDVYHAIRAKLVQRGIPVEEVAFIHDYPTRAKRDALFAAMNAGTVRVLIGSTEKMGTGMNVQQRLIALHHLDAPWRPGDVEQRDGRILRQGNMWPQCYIFHYVTEGSFDAFLWQLLETKARFISQVITAEVTARSADDIGETVLTAAEVKAIASGNPRILERFKLETERAKLERLRRSWQDGRSTLARQRRAAEDRIVAREQRIAALAAARATVQPPLGDDFQLTLEARIGDDHHVSYRKRTDAGAALRTLLQQYQTAAQVQQQPIVRTIGRYRAVALQVQVRPSALAVPHLILLAETTTGRVTIATRTLDPNSTPLGVVAAIDAGLRGITEEQAQQRARNQEDTATIAAATAELQRTATWEHEARWTCLCADLEALTAALTGAATPATPTATTADTPADTPDQSATTDTVSAAARAAVAQAIRAQADDPAWQAETTPMADRIPPAPESLALLRTWRDTPAAPAGAGAVDALPLPQPTDTRTIIDRPLRDAPTTTETARRAQEPPQPAWVRPAGRPVFGDPHLRAHGRPPRRAAQEEPSEQHDLFALPPAPASGPAESERTPTSSSTCEQLTLF